MTEMSPFGVLSADRASDLDPGWLSDVLRRAGWQLTGERPGEYLRFAPPPGVTGGSSSLLVPLDRTAPEFGELMREAAAQLTAHGRLWDGVAAAAGSEWQEDAAAQPDRVDTFTVHKEVAAPRGLIAWRDGERLFTAVGELLKAGMRAFREPQRRFMHRFGQEANAYLDGVYMGQTAPGSYIVTAYAPSGFTPSQGQPPAGSPATYQYQTLDDAVTPGLPERIVAAGPEERLINRTVADALAATVEALEHHRHTGRLSGFDEGVPRGVSRELLVAVRDICDRSEGAQVRITWDPLAPAPDAPGEFAFDPGDVDVLDRAAQMLAEPGPAEPATVIGRPFQHTRPEAGATDVIGIEEVGRTTQRHIRAHFDSARDIESVTAALRADRLVRVSGDLQRDGNITHLYHAHLIQVLGPQGDQERDA